MKKERSGFAGAFFFIDMLLRRMSCFFSYSMSVILTTRPKKDKMFLVFTVVQASHR
jgi:hypothetical protein